MHPHVRPQPQRKGFVMPRRWSGAGMCAASIPESVSPSSGSPLVSMYAQPSPEPGASRSTEDFLPARTSFASATPPNLPSFPATRGIARPAADVPRCPGRGGDPAPRRLLERAAVILVEIPAVKAGGKVGGAPEHPVAQIRAGNREAHAPDLAP